ncbi:hypothetical protein SESBI_38483 [Sesbania bispinosa]|nr:hypothetical protein SESBI_38483 [Sesbania bispinosa]
MGISSTTQLLANSSEETPVSSPLAPVSLLGSSKGEDQNQKAVTKTEKVQAVLKRIRQGISSTTQLLANSSEETPVSSPLAPVSLLGSSKGEEQNQKAVTKAEKVQAVLKRIRQGISSTTQLLANSSEETPVSSPLAPVSLLGSSKGEDQNQKAVTKAEKVQAVLKGIKQGISSTTQLLANSSEETPVSSPLAPVSLLGSSKGEDQNQKAVTKAEKVQAVLKGIKQGISSTTQLLANSSEETPVSSPLAPVSLLGSSKGEDQNQKAVTKAEKVQAVLKGIKQLLANSSEETPVSSPLAPVSLLGSSKGEDQNQKAVTKAEKVQALLKGIKQGISSTTQLLANSSEETPVSSPLAPVLLLGSSKGEEQNQKAVTKAEKVQAVLKGIRQV